MKVDAGGTARLGEVGSHRSGFTTGGAFGAITPDVTIPSGG
jgi:hypothetical protein